MSTVQAWACKDKGKPLVPWTYVPRALGADDIEIKIDFCGICGTDLHTIDCNWGTTVYPAVVGHEIVGRVAVKGANVKHVEVGDVVGVGPRVYGCLREDCAECSRDLDPHCKQAVRTYNNYYADGTLSYGGYADKIRVDSHFALKIPPGISPAEAAPLMCAGTTVFTPMLALKVNKGDRVGIVGIGGLGHLALQFASALGCKVTAFSRSESKRTEAEEMGAHVFVNSSDKKQMRAATRSLDFLFITSNDAPETYSKFFKLVAYRGKICMLSAPKGNVVLNPGLLLASEVYFGGSMVGGLNYIRKMLDFADKHNIRPLIQKIPMSDCNKGIEKVRSGDVRYRIVLYNENIEKSML